MAEATETQHAPQGVGASIAASRETMQVSVRESKMVTERLLMVTGLEMGLVPDVRDLVLAAQQVGEPALEYMRREWPAVSGIGAPRVAIVNDLPALLEVDGGGLHAPFVGPAVLDHLALRVYRDGQAALRITNVQFPRLLHGIVQFANQIGLATVAITAGDAARGEGALRSTAGSGKTTEAVQIGALTPAAAAAQVGFASDAVEGSFAGLEIGNDVLLLATKVGATAAPALQARESGGITTTKPEEVLPQELLHWHQHGYTVPQELWWALYHRSAEALTRSNEISRQHAGRQKGDRVNDPDWY